MNYFPRESFLVAALVLFLAACSTPESDCPPLTLLDIAAAEVADLPAEVVGAEVGPEVLPDTAEQLDVPEVMEEVLPDLPFEAEVTPECDDEIDCTVDSWFWGQGCLFKPDDSFCDDNNPCTADSCHLEAGCLYEFLDDPCEDDGDPCTVDACYEGECVHTGGNNGVACDDGQECTDGDYCHDGLCFGGELLEGCIEDCGDGNCIGVENYDNCAADCGACGDGVCALYEGGDEGGSCPVDCLPSCAEAEGCPECGDSICATGENAQNCPDDCVACGDNICSEGEDECVQDCTPACGNGICQGGESFKSCPEDCGPCGDEICAVWETYATLIDHQNR